MSKSQDTIPDTLPSTPASSEEDISSIGNPSFSQDEHQGDFARLIPVNRFAHIAFNDFVQKYCVDSETTHHAQQFVHFEKARVDPFSEPNGSDTETSSSRAQSFQWVGYYRLNMQIPPNSPSLGWVMGSGRTDLGETGVDFLLTAESKAYHVAGRQARLKHNLETCALLVTTGPKQRIGLEGNVEVRNGQRALTSTVTGISIGDLAYKIIFTNLSPKVYKQQIEDLRKQIGLSHFEIPSSLDPSPMTTHYHLEDFSVHAVFAEGSTCTVTAGTEKGTGLAVAVKRMKRNRFNFKAVENEIVVLKAIGQHPRICHLVAEIFSKGNQRQAGPKGVDEVYLIYRPLVEQNLSRVIGSDMDYLDRIILFKQCSEGIAFLHQKGLIHRDIKPGNIAVAQIIPPMAILIDLGSATWDQTSMNHRVGTIPYLAPEVIALKTGESVDAYDRMVDVWGLGLSIMELFCRSRRGWDQVDVERHTAVINNIQLTNWDPIVTPAMRLVERMLQWESNNRISAEKALQHPSLRDVDAGSYTTAVDAISGSKRARES